MGGAQRVGFFLLVLFFAGSVVVMAAHELQARSRKKGGGDSAAARRLIQVLKGETVANKPEGYLEAELMPQRRPGSYLQEHDRKHLNSLLKQVVPSTNE
jgi:hypothetical protein